MRLADTLLAALLTVLAGCIGGSAYQLSSSCSYDGETFPSGDGCNTCSCTTDGMIVCTRRVCEPSCIHEDKTYRPGETFPAGDGCNTCSCEMDGSVACTEQRCPLAVSVWLTMEPKQCHNNPWEQPSGGSAGPGRDYPVKELAAIDRYFRQQGIELRELGLLKPGEPRIVCMSCDCPRGDRLLARLDGEDVLAMGQFGFAALTMTEVLAYEPRQCGTNPWETQSKASGSEEESVLRWSESIGAHLKEVGFVHPSAEQAVCTACHCPRGDRLIVYPSSDQDARLLRQQGFSSLPLN